jgi:hypothetical protein
MKQVASFLAAVIVFAAVFLLVEQASPFFQSCVSQESGDAGQQAGKESYSSVGSIIAIYTRCSGRFIDGHGAGITAFFTIILAASTILLWIVTNKAANAAQVAAEHIPRIERAYMFGGPAVDGTTFDDPPNTVKIVIGIGNHGKTPGILVESYGEILSGPPSVSPTKYPFTGGKKWEQDIVYGASERLADTCHPFSGPKFETIYFIGYIKFRTIFDDKVHTSFWCVTPRVVDNVRNEWVMVDSTPGWNAWD